MNIQLNINQGFQWFCNETVFVKGMAFDKEEQLLCGNDLLNHFQNIKNEHDFRTALQALNGVFSVIIKNENVLMAAVDRVRNFPLLYKKTFGELTITDDSNVFLNEKINSASVLTMQYMGWVPGDQTLLQDVFQLQAGEMLVFSEDQMQKTFWHSAKSETERNLNKDAYKKQLKEIFLKIGKRLATVVANRPLALPLSGGYDSRMIALLLKMNGFSDVFCFTYGNPDCKEARNSQEIARRLGFSWMIVDYDRFANEDFSKDAQFLQYADFVGNAISIPQMHEFFAIRYLKQSKKIPANTLFLPGHSGDTIGGSHFFPDLKSFRSKRDLAQKIFRIYAQFVVANKDEKKQILNVIEDCFDTYRPTFSDYTDWSLKEYQAKQLVNGAKVFNFFGYEYFIPLSDVDLIDFFDELPLEYKAFKQLYDEVVCELYAEHGLLLDDEISPELKTRRKMYYLMKIRECFPFISKFRKRSFSGGFLKNEQMTQFLKTEKPHGFVFKKSDAAIAAWYVERLTKLSLRK